jgi:hypothetical protein
MEVILEQQLLSPEDESARLLFFRERGYTSTRRLAQLLKLPPGGC